MGGPNIAEISRQIIEILETAVQEPYLIGKKTKRLAPYEFSSLEVASKISITE